MIFHEKKLPEVFEINLVLNSGERLFLLAAGFRGNSEITGSAAGL